MHIELGWGGLWADMEIVKVSLLESNKIVKGGNMKRAKNAI